MRCPLNCANCTSGGRCTVCSVGYAFNYNNRCEPLACNSPCSTCLNATSLSNQCLICVSGYYLDNYQCKKCLDGCSTCNYVDYCDKCAPGYYLAADFSCTPCTFPCKTCVGPNPLSDCRSCADSYKYYDWYGACAFDGTCNSPCQTCVKGPSTCGSCINGYYKGDNSTCL